MFAVKGIENSKSLLISVCMVSRRVQVVESVSEGELNDAPPQVKERNTKVGVWERQARILAREVMMLVTANPLA